MNQQQKLLSIRQVSQLTGKSQRVICSYIAEEKIDCLTIDTFRAIFSQDIEKIRNIKDLRKQRNILDGHKTVNQMASLTKTTPANIKSYIHRGRIETVQHLGVYFIPDSIVKLWAEVKLPNPNKVEAYQFKAMTIQQAAEQLGCSDGTIRRLLREEKLETRLGHNRQYVTLESLEKYNAVDDLLGEL